MISRGDLWGRCSGRLSRSLSASTTAFFWVQASDFQLTHYLPAGIAVRWYFIEGRGANEIVPTFEAAKRLVEDWARGMEIEPWE